VRPDPLFVNLDAEARAGRNPRDAAVDFDGRAADVRAFDELAAVEVGRRIL
jgi:hypothetical protein